MLIICFPPSPLQAEAEEDCHSDMIRTDDDENESPAETDLQACFFSIYLILIPLLSKHKQQLVRIVKICRLFCIGFNCIFILVYRMLNYNYVIDFSFFSVKRCISNCCCVVQYLGLKYANLGLRHDSKPITSKKKIDRFDHLTFLNLNIAKDILNLSKEK